MCGVEISPQGFQERLNSQSTNEFLYRLFLRGMGYLVTAGGDRNDLLHSFNGVYIQDSSKLELPGILENRWQGNQAGPSRLKVHTVWNYQHGQLELKLVSGREHDNPLQTLHLAPGSLRLAAGGYFKVAVFQQRNRQGVWWLSRLPARAGLCSDGKVIHPATW